MKQFIKNNNQGTVGSAGIASLVKMAMLMMAASPFFKHGLTDIGTQEMMD